MSTTGAPAEAAARPLTPRVRPSIAIGVVGCGHWGKNHIRVFQTLPEVTVRGVAEADAQQLEQVCQLNPSVRGASDHRHLLQDPEINAIVIATPTSTHFEIARKALMAGKHVLCEKPLCLSSGEAGALLDIVRERGNLVLMAGHVFLFNPGVRRVKTVIDTGELGVVQYLSAVRTNLGPIRSDVNAAYDLAAHDIAVFNWLLGAEPVSVSATGASYVQAGVQDVAFISLTYPGKVLGSIEVSWLSPKKVREMTVVGTRQMVTWNDMDVSTPVAIYDKGADGGQEPANFGEFQSVKMWDGDVRLPKVPLAEPLRSQAEEFLGAIRDGRPTGSNAEFAAGVVRVLEAATESMRRGGEPRRLGAAGG